MMNTCIVKGASSCFSSSSPSPNRSNSYSPSSYSNSLHYRDSTSNNLFVNIEAAVELHDLTSRSQQLNNNNIKQDVSNIYHHQIQQIQRHHHLNHNALSNHPHLPSPHLINHNLTNHLTNQHLINHNLANHPQFANHPQLDEIFSSGVAAAAVAAVANLSQSSTSPTHSTIISSANSSANNSNNNQTNGANSSSSNNTSGNNQNNDNLMNSVDSASDQLDSVNQQHSPTQSQIYTPQQNNMISNFSQYHHQQNFASSPSLNQQQQHLHPSQLHNNGQHSLSQQNSSSSASALNQQQLSNANSLHHHVQNHNSLNNQQSIQQTAQQQLQSQSLANSIQQQLQQQHCSLQQQMLQTLQHLPQDGDLNCGDIRELEAFAERFKQRRIKLGTTQADVGRALANLKIQGVGCLSQSTICRFESLTLSHNNMVALKPILCSWLEAAENAARKARAVRDSMDASNLSAINCNGVNGLGGLGMIPGLLCNGDKKRKRTSIAAPEKRSLEKFFAIQPRPSGEKIAAIADKLELKKNVVRVWFCNQRQKNKRLKFSASGSGQTSN